MAHFYNREKEEKELRTILEDEPNLLYFVYGPIDSGKTSLLVREYQGYNREGVDAFTNGAIGH